MHTPSRRPTGEGLAARLRRLQTPIRAGVEAGDGAAEQALAPSLPEAAAGDPRALLPALRGVVARLEGRPGAGGGLGTAVPPGRLALGVPAFDRLFQPAGLPLDALVEIAAAQTREAGPLTAFAATLLVRLAACRPGPVLWVSERGARREAGRLAGRGLVDLGLDPGRLVFVDARDAGEMQWTMEEGLDCPGLAAVVGEAQGRSASLDAVAARRLALRARQAATPALLLSLAAPAPTAATAVRLAVRSRLSQPAGGFTGGAGHPAWRLVVERNRDGRPGEVDVEWRRDDGCFAFLPPLSGAVAPETADRPARPAPAGEILAPSGGFRRVS